LQRRGQLGGFIKIAHRGGPVAVQAMQFTTFQQQADVAWIGRKALAERRDASVYVTVPERRKPGGEENESAQTETNSA
jgi:hypothetical protein